MCCRPTSPYRSASQPFETAHSGTFDRSKPIRSSKVRNASAGAAAATSHRLADESNPLGGEGRVGQSVLMEDPAPSRRIVSQRIRNRIIEYFDLVASYEAQLEYEKRVPFVNVPYEVINQWEDSVPPPPRIPVDDLSVFSPEELREIDLFRPIWDAAADAIGKDFPTVTFVQSLPEWDRLRERAVSAASVFRERGLLPEDREVPRPVNRVHTGDGMDNFAELLDRHRISPFPAGIEKGTDYGEVDPVMIDADIFGWSTGIATGTPPDRFIREQLQRSRDQLKRSLPLMPPEARDYFERLIRIADFALGNERRT